MEKIVYVLGAGFSKSANSPLQSEIISSIFDIKNDELPIEYRRTFLQYRTDFKQFLEETMFIHENDFNKISLEDIYTPIDRCIIDNLAFRNISQIELIELRQKINGLIILMLSYRFRLTRTKGGHIENFTDYLLKIRKPHINRDPFAIISTNWDILIDNSFERKIDPTQGTVDYCCYTNPYDENEPMMPGLKAVGKGMFNIKILKLHGSINWLHCKRCQRLFVTFFEKIAVQEYIKKPICRICDKNFANDLTGDGGAYLSSQLIMPTFLKDLNNVQLKLIWQNAGIEFSEAEKIVFMGYSLPSSDFELRQLMARSIRHNALIDVVLAPADQPNNSNDRTTAQYRFKSFFGKRKINFYYNGVEGYINNLVDSSSSLSLKSALLD